MQFNYTVRSTDRTNCALDYATESLLRFSISISSLHIVYTVDGEG